MVAKRARPGQSKSRKGRAKSAGVAMNREIQEYKNQKEKYFDLLNRVDKWVSDNLDELKALLSLHVNYDADKVSYITFQSTLRTMEIPCTNLELQIITKLYDRQNENCIYFDDLSTKLRLVELYEQGQKQDQQNTMLQNYRTWILGHFKCLGCLQMDDSPLHFDRTISIDFFTEGLVNIIRQETGIVGPDINIYTSAEAEDDSCLKSMTRLCDQGIEGDEEWAPREVAFYYKICDFDQSKWSKTCLSEILHFAHNSIMWAELKL